jgi:hypothetical protein
MLETRETGRKRWYESGWGGVVRPVSGAAWYWKVPAGWLSLSEATARGKRWEEGVGGGS